MLHQYFLSAGVEHRLVPSATRRPARIGFTLWPQDFIGTAEERYVAVTMSWWPRVKTKSGGGRVGLAQADDILFYRQLANEKENKRSFAAWSKG